MEGNENFITRMTDEINQKGILVIDNVRRMPIYGEPYVSPHYTIGINHRGSVCCEYDGEIENFEQYDIAIVYPNHSLLTHSSSDDYLATLIIVSEKLYERLAILNAHSSRFRYEQHPHFILTHEQYNDVMTLVDSLRVVSRIDHMTNNGDMLLAQLHIFLQVINAFRAENDGESPSANTHISSHLYDAIAKHYMEHRSVDFYASLFCLSTKYFSTAIKHETGHSVNYWIQQHVILMTKKLIHAEPQLSLQEISERMGFPDLATFSRYFKRVTGITPSKYKQGKE